MSAKVKSVSRQDGEHHGWMFICPGCSMAHVLDARWPFNGDVESPTFDGSYLQYGSRDGDIPRCHLHIINGRLQFLADCDHGLRGKTVDMPEVT